MKIKIRDQDTRQMREYDLEAMSFQGLQELKLEVDGRLDSVKGQLGRAEATCKATGTYADPEWYWKAKSAQRYLARASQAIQQEMGRRGKEKRGEAGLQLANVFVDVARRRLDGTAFREMLDEARSIVEGI